MNKNEHEPQQICVTVYLAKKIKGTALCEHIYKLL